MFNQQELSRYLEDHGTWLEGLPGVQGYAQGEGIVVYVDESISADTKEEITNALGERLEGFVEIDVFPH